MTATATRSGRSARPSGIRSQSVRSSQSGGYLLWEGLSPCYGEPARRAPLALIATGISRPSKNPKTGPMVQTWLLRTDMPPHLAIASGEDEATCNQCPLRPHLVRDSGVPGEKSAQCYVNGGQAVLQIWKSYRGGLYPKLARRSFNRVFGGRTVRLGSYGNFSNVPMAIIAAICESAKWTMYEHNWRNASWLIPWAMASVSSVEEKEEANLLGWRTFRVKRPEDDILPDEVYCPADEERERPVTCAKCLLCCGTERKARNVCIDDHGPTAPESIRKRREAADLAKLERQAQLLTIGTTRLAQA